MPPRSCPRRWPRPPRTTWCWCRSINLTLLLFWSLQHGAGRWSAVACVLGAGAFLGLSILTKGLTGLAVVAVAYGGYLLSYSPRKLGDSASRCGDSAGGRSDCGALVPAMELRNPGFLRYYFLDRHLMGFVVTRPAARQPALVVLSADPARRRAALDRLSGEVANGQWPVASEDTISKSPNLQISE